MHNRITTLQSENFSLSLKSFQNDFSISLKVDKIKWKGVYNLEILKTIYPNFNINNHEKLTALLENVISENKFKIHFQGQYFCFLFSAVNSNCFEFELPLLKWLYNKKGLKNDGLKPLVMKGNLLMMSKEERRYLIKKRKWHAIKESCYTELNINPEIQEESELNAHKITIVPTNFIFIWKASNILYQSKDKKILRVEQEYATYHGRKIDTKFHFSKKDFAFSIKIDHSTNSFIFLGICLKCSQPEFWKKNCYMLFLNDGAVYRHGIRIDRIFNLKVTDNDIITMKIDVQKKEFSFLKNSLPIGRLFNLDWYSEKELLKICPCVELVTKGDQVTLI
jgi:hypothetical protein